MSTKNLGRTPLEAGHYSGKNQRKEGKNHAPRRTVRQQEREVLNNVDPEDDDFIIDEPSNHTRNSDKLGAVKRWIIAQCGRPWDKVYSEMAEKFDFNTMAGRHILGHIKGYVNFGFDHDNSGFFKRDFWYPTYVDQQGILRSNKNYRKRSERGAAAVAKREADDARRKEIAAWIEGRTLGREGAILFWYDLERTKYQERCENPACKRSHVAGEKPHYNFTGEVFVYHVIEHVKITRIRKLNKEEFEFFTSLDEEWRPALAVIDNVVLSEFQLKYNAEKQAALR